MSKGILSSVTVLVVEDEELVRQAIADMLEGIGVGSVVAVESGATAIEHLSDEESSIDLVICDIAMPEMDGFEFVRRVRYGDVPTYKDIPILMLTGANTPENVERGKYHRIQAFLLKPPDPLMLRKHILRGLGRGEGG